MHIQPSREDLIELTLCAGTQFDIRSINAVLAGTMLMDASTYSGGDIGVGSDRQYMGRLRYDSALSSF